jgi:hypothetical protein
MKPVWAHKALVGPDGQIVRKADGQPVLVPDRYRIFQANWPGYLCYAGAVVSLTWAVFLVLFGIVTSVRQGCQLGAAPNGGPARRSDSSGASEGPPSVS